jgi:ribosomal protein S21
MEKELKLTEEERELIEAIRNFRKSQHNYSFFLELHARELFEELLLKK